MTKNDDLVRRQVKFLREAANYFENRPTNGEDAAHWSNLCNAKSCRDIADAIERGAGIYSGPGEVSFTLSIGRNCTVDMGGMGFDAPLNDAVVTVRPRSHTFTAPPPAPQAADTRPGAANGSLRGERQALATPPAPAPDAGEECPTCGSNAPHLHPAVQSEGEVEVCPDAFHLTPTPQNRPEYIKRVQAKDPTPQPPAVEAEAVERLRAFSESAAKGIDILGEVVDAYGSADNHPQWQRIVVRQMAGEIHSVLTALKAKTDENERLRRERDKARAQALENGMALCRERSHRQAAEASNKALRKGLEPFADAASVVPGLRDEDECGVAGSYPPEGFKGRITVGDLRRARALLSETGGE